MPVCSQGAAASATSLQLGAGLLPGGRFDRRQDVEHLFKNMSVSLELIPGTCFPKRPRQVKEQNTSYDVSHLAKLLFTKSFPSLWCHQRSSVCLLPRALPTNQLVIFIPFSRCSACSAAPRSQEDGIATSSPLTEACCAPTWEV